jgi:hypothetical protein
LVDGVDPMIPAPPITRARTCCLVVAPLRLAVDRAMSARHRPVTVPSGPATPPRCDGRGACEIAHDDRTTIRRSPCP